MSKQQLIFIYNADSGLLNSLNDFAHKILSPSTYECHLCALTYGDLSMKEEWKSFIEKLPVKTIFFHKDEFLKTYKITAVFPAAFIDEDGTVKSFLNKEEIEQCKTLHELKNLISSKLKKHDQHHHTNI